VISSYALGLVLLVALALAWTVVQRAWAVRFPDSAPGGDALAGRLGCHGCGRCTNQCANDAGAATRVEEEP
jgi:hypothetical protein